MVLIITIFIIIIIIIIKNSWLCKAGQKYAKSLSISENNSPHKTNPQNEY